MATWAKC